MEKNKKITMQTEGATLKTYVTGFILSIVLTLIPYFMIINRLVAGYVALTSILLIAVLQFLVQLFFFLHLGKESKPRWKLYVLISFVGIILTIVIASIWIMQHLNYNMSLIQLDRVMQQGEGF